MALPPLLLMLYATIDLEYSKIMKLTPFRLAVQVRDVDESRDFYGSKIGFE